MRSGGGDEEGQETKEKVKEEAQGGVGLSLSRNRHCAITPK